MGLLWVQIVYNAHFTRTWHTCTLFGMNNLPSSESCSCCYTLRNTACCMQGWNCWHVKYHWWREGICLLSNAYLPMRSTPSLMVPPSSGNQMYPCTCNNKSRLFVKPPPPYWAACAREIQVHQIWMKLISGVARDNVRDHRKLVEVDCQTPRCRRFWWVGLLWLEVDL